MGTYQLTSQTGLLGEKLAAKYLQSKGYLLVAKNYYYQQGKRRGEIDIVAKKGEKLHFIEVKTRLGRKDSLGERPEAAVTREKLRKLEKVSQQFLQEKRLVGTEVHFDVISVIYYREEKRAEIAYLQDVFY